MSPCRSVYGRPMAARVYAVEVVKLLLRCPPPAAQLAKQAVAPHAAEWEQYRAQKHDLFIGQAARTDLFLEDAPRALLALENKKPTG